MCAFWGIASGIVGAVVVLMGVIALRPMLNAGYDVRLASGAITAGGTLGILIPPSVMLIVYAAVAGQSIVKLYAAAMLPGFFLTFLYLVYILGWAIINPKIAPKLPARPVPRRRARTGSAARARPVAERRPRPHRGRVSAGRAARRPRTVGRSYGAIVNNLLALSVPLLLTVGTFARGVVVRGHLQRARGGDGRTGGAGPGPRRRRRQPRAAGAAAGDSRRSSASCGARGERGGGPRRSPRGRPRR